LQFFLGNVAFPLLIFDTVATANLGSIDFGVILACSAAKLVVYWGTWIVTFFMFKPFEATGQRVLTATVFSFFSIAGDDFATGFPVIDALYGSSMTVYIAANSLVGSFLFVPMTLIMFQIGKGLRQRVEAPDEELPPKRGQMLRSILRNIMTNPVIIMTICGLIFQLVFGSLLVLDASGTKLQLPEPLASVIALWTGPFPMLALLSTGLSMTSAKLKFWPMVLVLLKLIVCAYLSYAFGLLFIYKEPMKMLHDFTFFYGSIPTSSAPLLFAAAFDPSVVEIIASAVLFGYILAGPNMFVMALFLSREDDNMITTLQGVQSITGILSAICGGLCLLWAIMTKKISAPSGPLLAMYSVVVVLYGSVDYYLGRNCDQTFLYFVFNFLQFMCTAFVLYFQVLLASRFSVRWHSKAIPWILVLAFAAAIAYTTKPMALDQLCEIDQPLWVRISTVVTRLVLAVIIFGMLIWAMCKRSRCDEVFREESLLGQQKHPKGIFQTLCIAQALRVLAQVVNSIDFLSSSGGVSGGRVQVVIIEQVLEVGQGIVLLVATLLKQCDQETLQVIGSWCRCGQSREPREKCEAANTFEDPGESIAAMPDQVFVRGVSAQSGTGSFRSRMGPPSFRPSVDFNSHWRSPADVEMPDDAPYIGS
jgi:hypothetical protein